MNDFCLVAGTAVSTSAADRRLWFRNVFTEPVGSLEQCEDPDAPYEPRGNAWSNCGEMSSEMAEEDPTEAIPAEIPDEEEEPVEMPTEEVEDHEEETVTEEAPESSSFLVTLGSAAFAGLISFLANVL